MRDPHPSNRHDLTTFDKPNSDLWVRLTTGQSQRWLIAGSAQTHRGHFHVRSADGEDHRSVNYSDVVEASTGAQTWLDGFLHGQQATLWEFLGEDSTLYEGASTDDEDRLDEWNNRFRQAGYGPSLDLLPAREPALDAVPDPQPWCYVGGLFRIWSDGDWRSASPQPQSDGDSGWAWPGTECVDIGSHELSTQDGFDMCDHCHWVSAI